MSEDSYAILFLKQHTDTVKSQLKEVKIPYLLRSINDKWSALFMEGDNYHTPYRQALLLKISKQVPLFEYLDAEDGGVSYHLYAGGTLVASADSWSPTEMAQVMETDYQMQFDAMRGNRNVAAFKVFGLDDDAIAKLEYWLSRDDPPYPSLPDPNDEAAVNAYHERERMQIHDIEALFGIQGIFGLTYDVVKEEM